MIYLWIPSEFVRKTRTLEELDCWKATELRLFLLYIGPVVLQKYLPPQYLLHFQSLHCAIRILCHETECISNNQYAKDLLIYFVETSKILYGNTFVIYNVHNLIHLAEDVLKFGSLETFSAFSFENFLHIIKKTIRKGEKPLEQLYNRIVERSRHAKRRNQYKLSKPECSHYNSKKSNVMGKTVYDSIVFKSFRLSVRKQCDKFCYLQNNDVFCIECIYMSDGTIFMEGRTLINSKNLSHYPVDSNMLYIYMLEMNGHT